MAFVVKRIGNNSSKGEKHFYLYEQHREGKHVVSKYIRPAANENDKPKNLPIKRANQQKRRIRKG